MKIFKRAQSAEEFKANLHKGQNIANARKKTGKVVKLDDKRKQGGSK